MPLGTLDRTAPPLFHQGPSALSKLIFFSAVAVFLMVADARFNLVQPIRNAIGTVLYPVQWVALKPVQLALGGGRYLDDLNEAQRKAAQAKQSMALLAERASRADALAEDNARLRELLELRETTRSVTRAAAVLFDAADPYSRKIVIDQGMQQGIVPGSPVMDADGVLGQVTSVQAFTSEVTLIVDRDQAIPVQIARTGARSVAFGDANAHAGGLELRFMSADADLREGDILATSGVDGVYPAGLPVARVDRIERRAESPFARIHCVPLADVTGVRYVLVIKPVGTPSLTASAMPLPAAPAKAQEAKDAGKTAGGDSAKDSGKTVDKAAAKESAKESAKGTVKGAGKEKADAKVDARTSAGAKPAAPAPATTAPQPQRRQETRTP
ncbi:rod shape-determining protein MreC [Variovorax dokdonensis]|uniref:rod shape-determining protein MreC n=1 Tax=Variovorax dokdonensis TaxID=344883 RepID=UPI003638716B